MVDIEPCSWGDPIWTCSMSAFSPAITGNAAAAAAEVLDALSGRQFGVCPMTIRPCRKECFGDVWPWGTTTWWEYGTYPRPLWWNGTWYNITCGQCTTDCSCSVISEVLLPTPIDSITQVKVDGVVLTPNVDYRLDDYRKLVRLGNNIWPICNELKLADTEVGTWSVTLGLGVQLPTMGRIAYGELATQFAKLLACEKDCMLPKPVQQLTRQGVQMNFLDPNEIFANGRIGLYACDLFITTYNPSRLLSRPRVYNVDGDNYRITG